jgi:hypothetical protein
MRKNQVFYLSMFFQNFFMAVVGAVVFRAVVGESVKTIQMSCLSSVSHCTKGFFLKYTQNSTGSLSFIVHKSLGKSVII